MIPVYSIKSESVLFTQNIKYMCINAYTNVLSCLIVWIVSDNPTESTSVVVTSLTAVLLSSQSCGTVELVFLSWIISKVESSI